MVKDHKEKGIKIEEGEIWQIAGQLTEALGYLHENKILHRDVKTLNVFIDRHGHVKVNLSFEEKAR
jgi:NIMA (never in mitosis gene a)-related kinase